MFVVVFVAHHHPIPYAHDRAVGKCRVPLLVHQEVGLIALGVAAPHRVKNARHVVGVDHIRILFDRLRSSIGKPKLLLDIGSGGVFQSCCLGSWSRNEIQMGNPNGCLFLMGACTSLCRPCSGRLPCVYDGSLWLHILQPTGHLEVVWS